METRTQQSAASAPDTRTAWTIDAAHSTIGFSAKHMMMMFATVRGRFRGVRGTIRVDDDHPRDASVEVDVATVDTGEPRRDDHMRSADFFDVAAYPTIAFRRSLVEPTSPLGRDRWRVVGDLTIRGVTRALELAAVQTGRGTAGRALNRAGCQSCQVDDTDLPRIAAISA